MLTCGAHPHGIMSNMNTENNLEPILLWPGSKRKTVGRLLPLMPDGDDITWYGEPFLGSGSVLFALHPDYGEVSDLNDEIMTMYEVIRENPYGLMERLRSIHSDKGTYLAIRSWDREPGFSDRPPVDRAARTIYLSLTGYNGLYRLNAKGQNNVAFDHFRIWNPDSLEAQILAQSSYLRNHDIILGRGDFTETMEHAMEIDAPDGAFVYLDPPYDSDDGKGFVRYTSKPFNRDDQTRLKEYCDRLDSAGARFMVTNADTGFIRGLYDGYDITEMSIRRKIGAATGGSSHADELVIRNYTDTVVSE